MFIYVLIRSYLQFQRGRLPRRILIDHACMFVALISLNWKNALGPDLQYVWVPPREFTTAAIAVLAGRWWERGGVSPQNTVQTS